ncbi:YybH family protein [Microbacterium sp. ZW T5_45]|uniref:YybH family protein n=1 Tax=Microbacterium sp. ZW T5_45 TaxID=3378080 RepID=UPI003854D9D9
MKGPTVTSPVTSLDQLNLAFADRFNARDLDGLMALNLPDVVFVPAPGQPVTGESAVRGALEQFLGLNLPISMTVRRTFESGGHRPRHRGLDHLRDGPRRLRDLPRRHHGRRGGLQRGARLALRSRQPLRHRLITVSPLRGSTRSAPSARTVHPRCRFPQPAPMPDSRHPSSAFRAREMR